MCLATVQKSDDTVVCRNVSRIDVDGEKVIIRDIMGDERVCCHLFSELLCFSCILRCKCISFVCEFRN